MRPLPILALAFALAACQPDDAPATDGVSTAGPIDAATDRPVAPDDASTAGEFVDPSERINLNTASADDFRAIPGVGDRMVGEFEEYRPYSSVEAFRREIGKYVDEDQVAAYERYLFVPVSINEATAATLQQLPGVSDAEAQQLIDGRPYASADAFLTAYASATGGDAEAARMYLAD